MNVLVTDGEARSALAVTRSLGRKGHTIFVSGQEGTCISACSRFCRAAYRVPDPMENGAAYAAAIADIVRRERIELVFPVTEQSVYILNRTRSALGNTAKLACAPPEKMAAVSNKYTLFQTAERLGVAMPTTLYVEGREDFHRQRRRIADFPVVVKPAYSKVVEGENIISSGVMYAADQQQLARLYESRPILRYPSLIQEVITGEGTGLFTLFDVDRHLALFSHRRLLEKPPTGGVSVLSESIPLDGEMIEAARRLLAEVAWPGVAMVEFKRDVRDGTAKLMEINGRFWGSLQLAVSSGIDFPALCLDYYRGIMPPAPCHGYRIGHRLKWTFGLLDHLLIRLKSGRRLKALLPPGSPGIIEVARELFRAGTSDTSLDVYDPQDPRPFAAEARAYVAALLGLAHR
ncbi:ATP-grasp domain-containing protein [Geobacter sp. SVR]|uniref:carboxylate--amine ligase n=1 Tax=Geobacter sp. SVR TaxID=2495594 RepID=UPI00143EFB35|nr:ATP-grasp domain-containing protein [Geobacter sp. SVR]BCS54956.1 ATP-grasp protein [Geobacter sp. SVR]GCF86155.1 ATP-grasp protein [Geobacter sp. SVR]